MSGRFALVVVTFLWGSTFVVVHAGLERISPLVLVASRYAVAAVVLLALEPAVWRGALRLRYTVLPLALANFSAMALQAAGLATTTPSRSAFLTALSVILVPILEVVIRRGRVDRRVWAAALVAGAGVYCLFRPLGVEWRAGDTLTLAGAVLFAFYVVELGRLASEHDTTSLVVAQTVTVSLMAMVAVPLFEAPRFEASPPAFLAVAYLGLVCTAAVTFLMTWGQARVTAPAAAVIYTLEPVHASAISVVVGSEAFDGRMVVGGGLIVLAMVASARADTTAKGGE